ncbi:hypothetical protein [Enterococcus gallinarum]|uniref:hypothetical protein n=1 Tax=Enterococcus gallinarum TaxID=1353 RepID=UPI001F5778D9|nr:hypothetical protein [Enterococcus gallinarum]
MYVLIDQLETLRKKELPDKINKFHELGYYVSVEPQGLPINIIGAEGRYNMKIFKWVES